MEVQDINSVCRLCLSETVFLSVLDENYASLPQKILSFVNVEVLENDEFSKMICKRCFLRIEDWFDFKKSCDEVQFKLRNWTGERLESVVVKTEKDPIAIEVQHEENISIKLEPPDDDIYLDESNPLQESTTSLLVPSGECSVNSYHAGSAPERCRICSKVFSSVYNRLRHEQNLHNVSRQKETLDSTDGYGSDTSLDSQTSQLTHMTSRSQESQTKPTKIFPLPRTEKEFVSYYTKMCHMIKNQLCLYCNTHYNNFKGLSSHLRKYHMKIEVFVCYFCWLSFPNLSQYKRHMQAKMQCKTRAILLSEDPLPFKPYQNFKCDYCLMLFSCEETMKLHMATHFPKFLPVNCTKCQVLFKNEMDFKKHLFSSCIYRVYCGICKADFPTIAEFYKHTPQHDADYPDGDVTIIKITNEDSVPKVVQEAVTVEEVRCRLCQDVFKSAHALLKHRRNVHKDPTVTICNMCPKNSDDRFVLHSELNDHVNAVHNSLSCDSCLETFSNFPELEAHQKSHDLKSEDQPNIKLKLYRCSETNSYVTSTPKTEQPRFSCEICDKYFVDKATFVSHQKLHTDGDEDDDEEEGGVFTCSICLQDFGYRHELTKHKTIHKGKSKTQTGKVLKKKQYRCQICNMNLRNYKLFRRHNKRLHRTTRSSEPIIKKEVPQLSFQCVDCEYSCGDVEELKEHIITTHAAPGMLLENGFARKLYPCVICNKICLTATALAGHMKFHARNDEPKFKDLKKCRTCGAHFRGGAALISHIRSNKCQKILKANDLNCRFCNRKFSEKKILKHHMRSHMTRSISNGTEERKNVIQFHCPVCKKNLPTLNALQDHLQEHKNNKTAKGEDNETYACDLCEMKFQSKAAYVGHKGWHTRSTLKPTTKNDSTVSYHCDICNIEFKTSYTYYDHRRTHFKNYHCKYCKNWYVTLARYKNHLKQAHGIEDEDESEDKKPNPLASNNPTRNYRCTECNSFFANAKSLRVHISKHTNATI